MGPCVAALVALCLIVVANGQVVTPIATQGLGYPAGVALDPAATIAYVTDYDGGRLLRVLLSNGHVTTLIDGGIGNPECIAMHPSGSYVLVADSFGGVLYLVDLPSGKLKTLVNGGLGTPNGIAIDPSGTYALVTDSDTENLNHVALPSGKLSILVSKGFTLLRIAIHPSGAYAVSTNAILGYDCLERIALPNGAEKTLVGPGIACNGVAIDPSGTFALLTEYERGSLYRALLPGGAMKAIVSGSLGAPVGVAIDPTSSFAVVVRGGIGVQCAATHGVALWHTLVIRFLAAVLQADNNGRLLRVSLPYVPIPTKTPTPSRSFSSTATPSRSASSSGSVSRSPSSDTTWTTSASRTSTSSSSSLGSSSATPTSSLSMSSSAAPSTPLPSASAILALSSSRTTTITRTPSPALSASASESTTASPFLNQSASASGQGVRTFTATASGSASVSILRTVSTTPSHTKRGKHTTTQTASHVPVAGKDLSDGEMVGIAICVLAIVAACAAGLLCFWKHARFGDRAKTIERARDAELSLLQESRIEPLDQRLRLSSFRFPGGLSALPELYRVAPGGAFGKVLLGNLEASGVPVAVKVMLQSRTDGPDFLRESENLIQLRDGVNGVRVLRQRRAPLTLLDEGSTHVAYVYGTGEEPDLAAVHPELPRGPAFLIAVEQLEETLSARMRRAPGGLLPIREALRAAHGVALGLAFMAKCMVVHADLKPDNIMFRADTGDAVLCDLGVGRINRAAGGSKYYGGTFVFSAPELFSVNASPSAPELFSVNASPSSASDVYAFAMVLWCLFTGRPHPWIDAAGWPPSQDRVVEMYVACVIRGQRPDCSAALLRADAPPAAVNLMQQGWSQNPADRPTALSMAVCLGGLLQ